MLNHGPEELSEREREILRLVATGASNKEIAHQLVISPNTVKVHLRNIFAKIGAASRTEAAMYAVRNRLVNESGWLPSPEVYRFPVTEQIPISITEPDHQAAVIIIEPEPQEKSLLVKLRQSAAFWAIILLSTLAMATFLILPRFLTTQEDPVLSDLIADSSQRWLEANPMTIARYFPAAVTYEGSIYVIGGDNQTGALGSMARFNPNSNEWLPLTDKPLPVSEIQAAVLADKIYIPGGKIAHQGIIDQMEIFDPQTNTWESGADLPFPISAYSLVTFEGKLYLFGGWNGNDYYADVYEFNPEENQWQYRTKMESPRAFTGSVVIGNQIYIAGGINQQGALSEILVYRPNQGVTGTWDDSIKMPSERYACGVATLVDSIYFIGGKNNQGDAASPWQYNPQSKEWYTYEPPDITDWAYMAVVPLQNLIYAFGGNVDGEPSAKVLKFQALYMLAIPIVR